MTFDTELKYNVNLTFGNTYKTPVHKHASRLDELLSGIMTQEEIEEAQELIKKIKEAAENLDEDDDDDPIGTLKDGEDDEGELELITTEPMSTYTTTK